MRVSSLAMLLLLSVALVPGANGQKPQSGQLAPPVAERLEPHVFRLQHIPAAEASRLVRELLGNAVGPRTGLAMSVDERNNSLIVSGAPLYLERIAVILQKIDVEGTAKDARAPVVRLISVKHLPLTSNLEKMLQLLVDGHSRTKFVVDRQLQLVIVSGEPAVVEAVIAFLNAITPVGADSSKTAAEELQVRVFWVISGQTRKELPGLPEDIKEVEASLGKLGVERPRLAAQLMVNTLVNSRFELGGMAQLDAPYRIALSGTATDRNGTLGLDLSFTANQAGAGRAPMQVATLRSQTTIHLGPAAILGVTATEGLQSALIVKVERRKPITSGTAKAQTAKSFSFEVRNAPWSSVLAWFSEQSGLFFAGSPPGGTFTFLPSRPDRRYTLAEIIDILNESLASQKLLLLRREHSVVIVAADEKVDPALLALLRPEDLDQHGKTELVQVVLKLHTLVAEELAAEVRKMTGPFGEVVVMNKANQLLLRDTVGNLKRTIKTIQELEQSQGAKN